MGLVTQLYTFKCRFGLKRYYYLEKFDKTITNNVNYLIGTGHTQNPNVIDLSDIFGIMHRADGPAYELIRDDDGVSTNDEYFYYGVRYNTKEDWFTALTPKEKHDAMWNINGI